MFNEIAYLVLLIVTTGIILILVFEYLNYSTIKKKAHPPPSVMNKVGELGGNKVACAQGTLICYNT